MIQDAGYFILDTGCWLLVGGYKPTKVCHLIWFLIAQQQAIQH
jgi:hypothetical protein